MSKKEGGSIITPVVAGIIGVLTLVFMALDFVGLTITSGGIGVYQGASGFTYTQVNALLWVIPVGGILMLLFGFLLAVPSMRKYSMIFGLLVLIGGLLALLGAVAFYMQASPAFGHFDLGGGVTADIGAGLGFWGVLIFGIIGIIVAILLIMKK